MEQRCGVDPEVFSCRIENHLYIRIAIRLMMNFVSSTARENQVAITAESTKKAKQEQIDSAVGKSSLHMDRFGSASLDLAAHGGAILSSGAANPLHALSDVAASLPNVRALLPDEEGLEDGEEEDDEDDEDDGEEAGDSADKPKKKKSRKGKGKGNGEGTEWWPREEFVSKKEDELKELIELQNKQLLDCLSQLRKEQQARNTTRRCFEGFIAQQKSI